MPFQPTVNLAIRKILNVRLAICYLYLSSMLSMLTWFIQIHKVQIKKPLVIFYAILVVYQNPESIIEKSIHLL